MCSRAPYKVSGLLLVEGLVGRSWPFIQDPLVMTAYSIAAASLVHLTKLLVFLEVLTMAFRHDLRFAAKCVFHSSCPAVILVFSSIFFDTL